MLLPSSQSLATEHLLIFDYTPVLEPHPQLPELTAQPATLQWLEQVIATTDDDITEPEPNVIDLAKRWMSQPQDVVEFEESGEYSCCSRPLLLAPAHELPPQLLIAVE